VGTVPKSASDGPAELSRQELIALGRTTVTARLEAMGCSVEVPTGRGSSKLVVRTPSGRSLEVFVSTQRIGGYTFWTKRRFSPATERYAAIVLLADAGDPEVYLVPSAEWRSASPPLTDRDNGGKRSEPEYGISLARSSLPALERYRWDENAEQAAFR
jgi:hypothetical protein